ncbi:MAG: ABC transporter permease, partial [Sulfolobales archaeon]|nr:ABC transporter permease [Sulfolobales archaeon]
MRLSDLGKLAFNALKDKRTRTILTVLGIMVGPAIVIAMTGMIQGFSIYYQNLFLQTFAPNDIFLSPKTSGSLNSYILYQIEQIPGVEVVVPYYLIPASINTPKGPMPTTIFSMNVNYVDLVLPSAKPYSGRMPIEGSYTQVAVGYYIANPMYPGQPTFEPGDVMTVEISLPNGQTETMSFSVVGALNEISSFGGADFDRAIYTSDALGRAIYGDQYSGAIVVAKLSDVDQVANAIQSRYGNYVTVQTVQQFLTFIKQSLGSFEALLVIAGASSFIVAFIGVTTTMLTTVVERTREIGLLSSLGFSKRDVLMLFLLEALIMGIIGTSVGTLLGLGGSYVMA